MTEQPAAQGTATRTLPPVLASGRYALSPAAPRAAEHGHSQNRISVMRTALIAGCSATVVVVIFIVQNAHAANISFLGIHLVLPQAGALLLAAIAGSLLTVAAGPVRMTHLWQITRRFLFEARTGKAAPSDRSLRPQAKAARGPEALAPSSLVIGQATADHRLPAHVTD
jgi:uncharacterized integral membrane protein